MSCGLYEPKEAVNVLVIVTLNTDSDGIATSSNSLENHSICTYYDHM